MTELADKNVKTATINMFHMLKYIKKNMKILDKRNKVFLKRTKLLEIEKYNIQNKKFIV